MDGGTKYHGMGWVCENPENCRCLENNSSDVELTMENILKQKDVSSSLVEDLIKFAPKIDNKGFLK